MFGFFFVVVVVAVVLVGFETNLRVVCSFYKTFPAVCINFKKFILIFFMQVQWVST